MQRKVVLDHTAVRTMVDGYEYHKDCRQETRLYRHLCALAESHEVLRAKVQRLGELNEGLYALTQEEE